LTRRKLFSALVGAPAAIPAKPAPPPKFAVRESGFCVCGGAMIAHGSSLEGTEYFSCTRPDCPQYDVPLKPPRMETERADPRVVQRVRAREAAGQRQADLDRPHGLYDWVRRRYWHAARGEWVDAAPFDTARRPKA
jgi:hypothetical protein